MENFEQAEQEINTIKSQLETLVNNVGQLIDDLTELKEQINDVEAGIISNEVLESEPGLESVAQCSKGSFILGSNNAVFFKANPDNDLKPGDDLLEFERGILKVGNDNQVFYAPK